MATQGFSKIYGHPRFGFILGLFLASIVMMLIAGVVFFHVHPPKARDMHRTGMVLLLSSDMR